MLPLEYFLYLQIILFLFITPGTPRIVIISYSMNYGVKKCIWVALGDVSANIIQATLVIFVIGSFFSEHPIFLILLTTYVILDFVSLIGYAILANNLIAWLNTNPKIINKISACVLIILSILIVFTQKF